MTIATFHDRVLAALRERLSPINAQVLLVRALEQCRLTSTQLQPRHMLPLIGAMTPGLRTFLSDLHARDVITRLRAMQERDGPVPSLEVEVKTEPDIVAARHAAREHCSAVGADSFAVQRVLTVVSELARNIVNYSVGGRISFEVSPVAITIHASDAGPGIANLDDILAGRYRSRTGLGLGILGVKRLARDMSITTSPEGTQVTARVAVT